LFRQSSVEMLIDRINR